MLKEIKDLSKNVRLSSEAFKEIKESGLSVQRLLDQAIAELRARKNKPKDGEHQQKGFVPLLRVRNLRL